MQHQESPVRARLREALLQKLLGTGLVRNDPAVQTAARTEVSVRVDARLRTARPATTLCLCIFGT